MIPVARKTNSSEERRRRSDLLTEAYRRLRECDPRLIHYTTCNLTTHGILTLYGVVPTYYLKQMAQHAVAGLQGVAQIENRLTVADGDSPNKPDAVRGFRRKAR